MRRRSFFTGAAALGALRLIGPQTVHAQTRASGIKITDVEIWQVVGQEERMRASGPNQYMVQPGDVYPENRPRVYVENRNPSTETTLATNRAFYVKILTNGGLQGFYGTISQNQVTVILGRLRRSLIGMDPLSIDTIWHKLYLGNNHGYAGDFMEGLSSIDICLWDLKGKFCNMPVYKLLGGSRTAIECYASALRFPVTDQDLIQKYAAELKAEGYKAQKWFFAYGPSYGDWGIEQNVMLVRTIRETLGEHYTIYFDAFEGWDLNYAIKMFTRVKQYQPDWIEEPVMRENVDSFARLRQMFSIPIATGEHTYGRWSIAKLIKADAVDVIQCDPEWCGGISETIKICHLASAHDLVVSPHNQRSIALAHVIASQPPTLCPIMEYQVNLQPRLAYFEKNPIIPPKNGQIELPDRPGFGIELDESKIQSMEKVEA